MPFAARAFNSMNKYRSLPRGWMCRGFWPAGDESEMPDDFVRLRVVYSSPTRP